MRKRIRQVASFGCSILATPKAMSPLQEVLIRRGSRKAKRVHVPECARERAGRDEQADSLRKLRFGVP